MKFTFLFFHVVERFSHRFFKQELERETDPFRRNLLLQQIRDVEQRILDRLNEQRAQVSSI
jgi:hypothetical protein